MMRIVVATLAYCWAFQFAYVSYIYPTYGYANFRYFPQSGEQNILTFILAFLPTLFSRKSESPSSYGAAIIFVLCYVPAIVMVPYMLDAAYAPVMKIQMSLMASMSVLFIASALGSTDAVAKHSADKRLLQLVGLFTSIALTILISTNYKHMRLVSFADVYDLRADASKAETNGLLVYLVSWLSYCFLPFFIAKGLARLEMRSLALGMAGCFLVYISTGAKSQILLPFIMLVILMMMRSNMSFLLVLCSGAAVSTLLVLLFPDDSFLAWGKSTLLMRTLATGGWTVSLYYEYFTANGYTYFSHIRIVDFFTHWYPYGGRSLGQIIGLEYSGSDLANFNANFWASDGFAAWGLWGIPVVTSALAAFFVLLNRIASYYETRFVALWMTGFWLALLNLPLSTAILSGGGGLVVLFLWTSRVRLPIGVGSVPGTKAASGA
jgi:hypothetical protein